MTAERAELIAAGKPLDIPVTDCLVVRRSSYTSLRGRGV